MKMDIFLKRDSLKTKQYFYILICLFIISIFLPFIHNTYYYDIIFYVILYAILAEAWNLLTGYAGPVSLGHIVYFGLGAYISSILFMNFGINPWVGTIFAAFIVSIFASVMGFLFFRLRTHFFALATIALLMVMRILASYFVDLTGGNKGLLLPINAGAKNMVFVSKLPYIYIGIIILVILITYMFVLETKKFGYSLIAVRENEDAAKAMGINPISVWTKANMISAFFMSLGGSLYAQYVCYIDPTSVFGMDMSVKVVLYAIIGGIGTIIGPLLGTTIMVPAEILFRTSFGRSATGLNMAIYGVFLIIFAIYAKDGLISVIRRYHNVFISSKKKVLPISNQNSQQETIKSVSPFLRLSKEKHIVLAVNNLTKNFGGLEAVKDFSFSIESGEILGIIGPNGAGKTTIFNMITGFIPKSSGSIIVDGKEYNDVHPWTLCDAGVTRTFQSVKPFKRLSVLQNVMIGAFAKTDNYYKAKEIALSVIDFMEMNHKLHNPLSKLTVYDLKKLELAKILATRPKVILLDEIMSGLTQTENREMIELIRQIAHQNIAIVIVEHVMKVISLCCERVLVLNFGELLAEGTYKEIIENEEVIRAYLGGSHLHA